jgi:hypothetical protein
MRTCASALAGRLIRQSGAGLDSTAATATATICGAATRYAFDKSGNLTQVRLPSETTSRTLSYTPGTRCLIRFNPARGLSVLSRGSEQRLGVTELGLAHVIDHNVILSVLARMG